jgi:hypothetical protein
LKAAKSALSEYSGESECIHHTFELIANLIAVMSYETEGTVLLAQGDSGEACDHISTFLEQMRSYDGFIGSVNIGQMIVKTTAALDLGFGEPAQTVIEAGGNNGLELPEAKSVTLAYALPVSRPSDEPVAQAIGVGEFSGVAVSAPVITEPSTAAPRSFSEANPFAEAAARGMGVPAASA